MGSKVKHKQTLQLFAVPMMYNMAAFCEGVNYSSTFEKSLPRLPAVIFKKKPQIFQNCFQKLDFAYKGIQS